MLQTNMKEQCHPPHHVAVQLWARGCGYHSSGLEFANSREDRTVWAQTNTALMRLSCRQPPGAGERLCCSDFLHMGILLTLSAGEWWSAWENKNALLLPLVVSIHHNSDQHRFHSKPSFRDNSETFQHCKLWKISASQTSLPNDTE